MVRVCKKCRNRYDDARATTICPHQPFLSETDAVQKDAALKLLGKSVVFAHRPAGVAPARVTSVGWNGMVTLHGWAGEFAPHVLVEVEPETAAHGTSPKLVRQ